MTTSPNAPTDALQDAVDGLATLMIADAQTVDPGEWAYVSRVLAIRVPEQGFADVQVSSWLGRLGHEFRGINIDPDSNLPLVHAALAEEGANRLLIVRVTRMPQAVIDPTNMEVAVEFTELAFDEPVDASDPDLGGFSLFGDI